MAENNLLLLIITMKHSQGTLYASILLLLSLIWGSSYILMREGLLSFSPVQIAGFRIFFTWLCFLPISIKNLKFITRKNIKSFLIIGLCGNAIPSFLFPIAQTKIETALAGMLNSISPVFTLIIGGLLYSRKIKPAQAIGVALGFIGALGLLYKGELSFNYFGLFIILATFLYGISANEIGTIKGLSGFAIMSLAFFFIGPVAAVVLLLSGLPPSFTTSNWPLSLGCILILAVVGTFVANSLYTFLIVKKSPMFAVSVTYLSPVVSTIWGMALHESINSMMIVSIIAILAGVYIITSPAKRIFQNKT